MTRDRNRRSESSSDATRPLSRRTVLGATGTLAAAGLLGFGGTAAAGNGTGNCLPSPNDSSPRPGPSVLYDSPVSAPQFENGDGWDAAPLRVSGTDAYVEGEYLFQDFIYDDHGANTTTGPVPPAPRPDHHDFSPMTGDVVYPTDEETYLNNAADLLEFRCRLTNDGEIVYRFTLNTMTGPDVAALAVGINADGSDVTGSTDWGYGLGELGAPADHVLVTWGTGAELNGKQLSSDRVEVDTERNQIEVTVPLRPDGESWRHYLVTGLWNGSEFTQVKEQPDEESPGGAHGMSPPPVFNVGFRYHDQEPMEAPHAKPDAVEQEVDHTVTQAEGSRSLGYGYWREDAQSKALAARDISQFHADVDFAALADGTTRRNVPETGYLNRIYVSREKLGSGGVGRHTTTEGDNNNDEDVLRGRLIPYSLYIPDSYDGSATPLHVHLHSLSGNHNQYAAFTPDFLRQVGDERGKLILTTTGRGPGVPYDDQAELDLFEAWNDAAARYAIDFDGVTIGGYSMGAIGTHRIASKWPDLFAKGFPIVGSIGDENTAQVAGNDLYTNLEQIAINQRHVPLLMWQGTTDELVPYPLAAKYAQHLRDLGLRHEFDTFPGYDHLTFAFVDEWEPAAEFLDGATVTRQPPRVTYRRVPALDNDNLDLVHDHIYWLSNIETAGEAADGLVDVRSLAFGEALPTVEQYNGAGTEPAPHTKQGVRWSNPLVDPAARNALELSLEEIGSLTVWVEEAEIDPTRDIELTVESTTPATVTLASSLGSVDVEVPAGQSETTVRICGETSARPYIDVSRADDGSAFTGGQTDQVDITVDAWRSIKVRDRLPDGWEHTGGGGEVTTDGETRYVEFSPSSDETYTYFAKAPSDAEATGTYTFGPVEIDAGYGWTPVRDTEDTNLVVGQST